MNAQTERLELAGPAGRIQVLRDQPAGTPRGTAVIAHPHPLFGGTMDNKVVQTLARAFVQCGWTAVRFNFRGVGTSEGAHDNGEGETLDLQHVLGELAPQGEVALAGFSFGAYVTARALQSVWGERDVRAVVLVGTAAARFQVPELPAESHDRTLVIHGEVDDTVPLAAALDWARPQSLPVTVVPGVEHFFHGQLPLLKNLVVRHLRAQG
ncbi:alpha/beta fold hydrolase [Ramlibacter sp. USB13]|uniref:Alpha/beta fold hydrolase n=1 Tax=Ramlibacter cellulosilyticus TaxID=2764187 RepID=A0A923MPU9_9BURK|nr:alpha/beta fold hydrolase [Ramlibacter cellulosilyticus]MBC5783000.1 alpha/beta fold hydrolase [Ramlibacter cellulosilyticus]